MEQFVDEAGEFKLIIDPYNGITVKKESIPKQIDQFVKSLDELMIYLTKVQRNLIWIDINIDKSYLIPYLTMHNFVFHTCQEKSILLVKKVKKEAIIPTASNHTLGVGVVVLNEYNELLVIKERISTTTYKLPGGHIDDGEMISQAVAREVLEETGVEVVFESIVSLGHFFPHQFNKSNLYIICLAKPISYDINIQDTNEIEDAKWMDVDEYLQDDTVLEYNKVLVNSALDIKGFKSFDLESFKHIPKRYELFGL